jgi:hypothetical protein
MASQHADPTLGVRAPAELRDAATATLTARDMQMQAFVVACLTAVTANPDQMLKALAKYWPEPKPRGRPRKAPQ